MSIQLNQEKKLPNPCQWVHWNYVILSMSWINLFDGDLGIVIGWTLQLKIWSRGSSVLIWLIRKSVSFFMQFSERKFLLEIHTVVWAHYLHLPNTTWQMFIASGTDWCTRWRVPVAACQLQKGKKKITWKTLLNLENNHFHSRVWENLADNEQIDIS